MGPKEILGTFFEEVINRYQSERWNVAFHLGSRNNAPLLGWLGVMVCNSETRLRMLLSLYPMRSHKQTVMVMYPSRHSDHSIS